MNYLLRLKYTGIFTCFVLLNGTPLALAGGGGSEPELQGSGDHTLMPPSVMLVALRTHYSPTLEAVIR